MSRKMLIIGIMLAMSWTLFAAGNANVDNVKANYMAGSHAKQVVMGKGDALNLGSSPLVRSGSSSSYSRDTADTLAYGLSFNTQFIMSPGDAMLTVFQMPADGILKGVNVPVAEWGTGDQQLTISLHEMSYPYGADGAMYDGSVVDGDGWVGGYDMDANGWVSITGTTYTPGGTAGICADPSAVADNARDPLGDTDGFGPAGIPTKGLLWPDGFTSATLDPTNNPAEADNWVATADFGSEPVVTAGTWVGILVQSTGSGGGDDDATGFYYASGSGFVDPWVSLKFYGECSGTSGNGGWHIRNWVFDYNLAVLLTGDRAPIVDGWSDLPTTLSTADRVVDVYLTDDNPSGGAAGVASASLFYQLDSLTATVNEVALTMTAGTPEDGTWSGTIPGQVPGTFVYYWFEATDVGGNDVGTATASYYIFAPTVGNDLIFNDQDPLYGSIAYSSYLYFYWGGQPFDIWDASYGNITKELVDNYSVIIEEAGTGPYYDTDEILSAWYSTEKTLLVSGDEWLGVRYGWPGFDAPYTVPDGDFAKDVMGVETYYSDINYYASGDQAAASRLTVNSGDAVVGGLADFLADSLSLNYNPDYETGGSNWLDGIDPATGFTAAMTGFEGPLADAGDPDPTTTVYNTMIYGGTAGAGGTALLTFDAIALNTVPGYWWIGAHEYSGLLLSPLGLAYEYFTGGVGVGDQASLPNAFELKGNYPNPFNPSTQIAFNIGSNDNVTVKVFSLLGEEIATVHNGILNSGSHEVTWNGMDNYGSKVSSGVYLYQVATGGKTLTGKMMLIK